MYENTNDIIIKAQENKEELGKLIEGNSGLIWSIVKRFLGRGYETDDLYQIGALGFIKAIKRFDTSYNVQISTFAVPYILGEIKKFIRDDGPIKISRSIKELAIKIREIQKKYLTEKGEEVNILELSKELNVPKEEIAVAIDSLNPIDSIDEKIYDNDNSTESKINRINIKKDETTELINKMCLKDIIKNLNERDKQIILLRYYKEKTQTEVASILGITQVQVSRLEKKILINIRENIA